MPKAGPNRGGGTRGQTAADRGAAEPPPIPALRWAAAARGHGPGAGARPAAVPVRRATVEPGREAAGGDAHGDQAPAPAPRIHHRLRHARSDRGDDAGHPYCCDAPGRGAAIRRPRHRLQSPGQPVRRPVHGLSADEHDAGGPGPRRGWPRRDGGRRCRPANPTEAGRNAPQAPRLSSTVRSSWAFGPNALPRRTSATSASHS